ncbi:MAG: taurine dioxygenase [Actinobacteria bacterium]|nr:taurine dioxygenase [Actinomycetota bacterium]
MITVEQVAGACGAVVHGADLAADLDDAEVAQIRQALLDHQVVFFRGQRLDPDQQVRFSRRLGPPSPVPFVQAIPEHPEVIAVVREATETHGYTFGGLWHSDFSFLPEPPSASILHALEVPPFGGDTVWASQTLAYRTLSPAMRQMLTTLEGVHSAVNAYSPKMQAVHDTFAGMSVQTDESATRTQVHPAVRAHGETGVPALFVNAQYTVGLCGFAPHEARPLLDFLAAHTTRTELTCRWQWRVGDVAIWDNRAVQHMAMADFTGHRRAMHRTTVAGEAPVAASSLT